MGAIYRRDMQCYFYSPAAYVFVGVFLALSSVFFGFGNLAARSSDVMSLIERMSYIWMLLSPVLTMRLIAGERQQRTDQLLYASPCSLSGLVAGKYAAACTVLLIAVCATVMYPLVVAVYGTLYVPEALVGYLGLILTGCAFIALDLFVSCFARSQMTAVVAGMGVNLVVWLADAMSRALAGTLPARALGFISLYARFEPFVRGQMSLSNVFYDLLFIFIMLFLSVRVLDARRWSEA